MQSNVLTAGRDINIVVGAATHDSLTDILELAKWLSPVNSLQIQKDVFEKVMEGTGTWIFEHPGFIDWISKKGPILWGSGMPGAGKTCITSIVINHLIKDRCAAVIYIYCQYKDQLSAADIYACLLRQAVQSSQEVAIYVEETLYKPCLRTDTKPSKSELFAALRGALQQLNDLYLVVDALDELRNDTRTELLSDLISLQHPILMTSRPLSDLPRVKEPNLEIRATNDDLHDFISSKIDNIPQLRRYLQDPGIREESITKILGKCQGMFLLAALQIDALASGGIIDRRSLREAVENLPITLNDQYELTLERIRKQSPGARRLAYCAIVLITHATRTLKVAELLEALTVDTDAVSIDGERRTTTDALLSVSLGLLTIEKESETVQLIHYTAQDFFEGLKDPPFSNPHSLLANISAIYMFLADVDSNLIETINDLSSTRYSYPFLSYACLNLGYHAYQAFRWCNGHIPEHVSDLFRHKLRIPIPLHPLVDYIDHGQVVHFAARYGLPPLLLDNQQTLGNKSTLGCSPLFYACVGGQTALAEQIISKLGPDLDVGCTTKFGATILHAASRSGDVYLVQRLLLECGQTGNLSGQVVQPVPRHGTIDINARMSEGQTALHLASDSGHASVVEALLNYKGTARGKVPLSLVGGVWSSSVETANPQLLKRVSIDVNAQDNRGWTPLHLAANSGYESVVRFLLNSVNTNVNAKDNFGRTPLYPASMNGHVTVVRLLLNSPKIDVNAKAWLGGSPLYIASKNGHESVVRLLLRCAGIDVNTKDQHKTTPLHMAANNGHEGAVRLLLSSSGVDINAPDSERKRPLHRAAEGGHTAVVRLLIDSAHADINTKDWYGHTPLHLAAKNGHQAVVGLLLKPARANVNAKTWDYRSPLHLAAANGHEAVVQLLLESPDVDINAKDLWGSSPLHEAAVNGREAAVRLLLKSTVIDVDAEDRSGNSSLHLATCKGHETVVRLILDRSKTKVHGKALNKLFAPTIPP